MIKCRCSVLFLSFILVMQSVALIFFIFSSAPKEEPLNRDGSFLPPNPQSSQLQVVATAPASRDPTAVERFSSLNRLASKDIQERSRPLVVSGFNFSSKLSSKVRFLQEFRHHPQYVKGIDVQPIVDNKKEFCVSDTGKLFKLMAVQQEQHLQGSDNDSVKVLNFFTNDQENEPFLSALQPEYTAPPAFAHVNDFKFFSALPFSGSHPFHRHGASWIGSVAGYKTWWFLPPNARKPDKVPACQYKEGTATPPEGVLRVLQKPGDVIFVPSDWWHATCADSDWTVGVGAQNGSLQKYKQAFPPIKEVASQKSSRFLSENFDAWVSKMTECGLVIDHPSLRVDDTSVNDKVDASDRIWFDGDLNEYYNKLERDEHNKRRPNIITTYAVHRWMGKKRSTLEHYNLIRAAIHDTLIPTKDTSGNFKTPAGAERNNRPLRVLDAGCGLGAGLMWMEQREPTWKLVGRTISSDQHKWIVEDLPVHKFRVALQSYDELDDLTLDAIYSIEALIHTPDLSKTLKVWSDHLAPGGAVIIIDDFLTVGTSREDEGVDLFAKSWLANSVVTTLEFSSAARKVGMDVIQDRDLITEYNIIELNYRNKAPKIEKKAEHQGWLGSSVRQALTVNGKLTYRMLVLRKRGGEPKSQ